MDEHELAELEAIFANNDAGKALCAEVRRLMALVNLCIDDPQHWTQRAIELELYIGQDVEFYNQSVLAENKSLRATRLGARADLKQIINLQSCNYSADEFKKLALDIAYAAVKKIDGDA